MKKSGNIKGYIKLSNAVVEHAFRNAEKPITSQVFQEQKRTLRHFANGKLLKMWCDVQEYDFERVQRKLLEYLNK